jgi:hypothetical protein
MGAAMGRDELAEALFAAAERTAQERGMRFDDGVDSDVRRLAVQAAERMLVQNPAMHPGDPLLKRAEAGFEQLAEGMVSQVRRYRDDDAERPALKADTLARALSRLCPLFPIC